MEKQIKKKVIRNIILKCLAILCSILPTYILFFYLILRMPLSIYFALIIPLIPTLISFSLFWLILHKKTRKVLFITSISFSLVTFVSVSVASGREIYLDSIRIVDNSNIMTSLYLPFDENSKIARLDKESSLKFKITEKLPVLDGASALFPMYSSFINATYPSNIEKLNRTDGCFYYTNTMGSFYSLANNERDIIFGVDPDGHKEDFLPYNDTAKASFDEINKTSIGREGFVFFTHVNNKVDSLTVEQYQEIYSGKIKNWKEVGGSNIPIKVFNRNPGSGSYIGLEKFMNGKPIISGETTYIFGLMSGIIEAVADYENYPGAIGYSYYYYASKLQENNNIKILGVNDIIPSKETIGNKTYPITDDFYMIYNKNRVTNEMTLLMNWIVGEEGQELVDKSGYARIN